MYYPNMVQWHGNIIKMISIRFADLFKLVWKWSFRLSWHCILRLFQVLANTNQRDLNVRKMLPFFVSNRILTGFRFAASFVSQRKWIVPTAIQQFVSQWCFVPAGLSPQQNRCRFKLIQVDCTVWFNQSKVNFV